MAGATERDADMQLLRTDVISAVAEFRNELIEHRKMMHRGLASLASEVAGQAKQIAVLQATEADCQKHLAALSTEVAAMKADGAARAILMKWLLTFGMLNAVGAVIVAALLIYMVLRLFSLAV